MERKKIMNKNNDADIWGLKHCDATDLKLEELCDYLLGQLNAFLMHPISVKEKSIFSQKYATYFIRSEQPFGGIFQFEFDGSMTLQILDEEIYIYSTLRLFSLKERIGLQRHEGQSIVELVYEKKAHNENGKWQIQSWVGDDAGEWEDRKNID
ncbi:MAG: hypothetical protein GY714_03420 [Desulfobacterales bacterium]|nr:hypothetical protein [Desulfobacterales bacterium]